MLRVKIGNKIYDAGKEPIMIICTDGDRQQMAEMPKENTKYCQYPKTDRTWAENDFKKIKKFMEIKPSDWSK